MAILVVDDVRLVAQTLHQMLSESGYEVLTALSGREALEILKSPKNKVDVVITDLLMPSMNGVELFRAAQQIELLGDTGALPSPEFILITALRPDQSTAKEDLYLLKDAMNMGFAEIILKPVDRDVLVNRVSKLLQKRSDRPPTLTEPIQQKTQENDSDVDRVVQRLDQQHREMTNRVHSLEQRQKQVELSLANIERLLSQQQE